MRPFNIFNRISLLTFILIAIPAVLFMIITYLSATHFYQSSTQLVNKEVAGHIAKFTSPFEHKKINREKADSVFYNAMVISPGIEVYFLDTSGKVIAYHADSTLIKQWQIPLTPVRQFLLDSGKRYVTGLDPKDPLQKKIFSAAAVKRENSLLGYIYVILASKDYRSTSELLFGSHVTALAIKGFLVIVGLSLLFSFLYVKNLRKRFVLVTGVFDRFRKGDYSARFDLSRNKEILPVMEGFNHLAALLEESIGNLRISESERKELITRIAHDIRTPIATARGFTETLLFKQHSIASEKEYLQLIFDKLNFIESLVQQLFELSKLESADFHPKTEPLVFSEILQENLNTSTLVLEEKKILLSCKNCKDPVWVNADVAMTESLIQNLISNAVNNTHSGGTITIEIKPVNRQLYFTVENSGSPFSLELLRWLNEKSVNFPLGKRPNGSGIGLALIKKISLLHNFSLEAESGKGKNIFRIIMPVYSPNNQA